MSEQRRAERAVMRTYTIDTNAGPIIERPFAKASDVKRYMERMIPLLSKRGYSHTWRRSGRWHVIDIANSRGRVVHSAAFRSGAWRTTS